MKTPAVDSFRKEHRLERRAPLLYLRPEGATTTDPAGAGHIGHIPEPDGWAPDEPSTIWTHLKVAARRSFEPPHANPSYRQLKPGQRKRYLAWLAEERLDPNVDTGFALLYYGGLERRSFGSRGEQAGREILALRRAFGGCVVLQRCSEHALFASALYRREHAALAHLVEEGAFDQAPLSVKSALLDRLTWVGKSRGVPQMWLLEAIKVRPGRERTKDAQRLEGLRLKNFAAEVEARLRSIPLARRLEEARADAKRLARLEWELANRSPSLIFAEPIEYVSILEHAGFVRDFQAAWRRAGAKAEEDLKRSKLLTKEAREERREQKLREQLELWETFDVNLELRLAMELDERGDRELALRRLKRSRDKLRRDEAEARKQINELIAQLGKTGENGGKRKGSS